MTIRLNLTKPNSVVPVIGDRLLIDGRFWRVADRLFLRAMHDDVNQQLYVEVVDIYLEAV